MSPARPPRKPYFLRALHEWIADAGMTAQIIVDASVDGVAVPEGYAQDGKIVLNISPQAVQGLRIDNELVQFTARFNGAARPVSVPMAAVLGIYARETGEGLAFGGDDMPPEPPSGPDGGKERREDGDKRPHLKVVK